eukprot:jgi/Tetstr1/463931/TSEL_008737.t1
MIAHAQAQGMSALRPSAATQGTRPGALSQAHTSLVPHRRGGARRLLIRATAEPEMKGSAPGQAKVEYKRPVRSKEKKDIYLGKGRTIKDDPKKYPDRNELGVGGWAGGEVGLWEFREEVKSSPKSREAPGGLDISKITGFLGPKDQKDVKISRAQINGMQVDAEVRGEGQDLIYIGKSKGEAPAPGKPGKFIKDSAKKYPGKEDVGIMYGATGGFAGGEEGLKQFVETGDVDMLPPGVQRSRPPNPLLVLFAVGGVAGLAAAYGSLSGDAPSSGPGEMPSVPALTAAATTMDSSSVLLLQLGLIGFGSVGAVVGGRAALAGARRKLVEGTKDTLVYALFSGGLVLALYAVLLN